MKQIDRWWQSFRETKFRHDCVNIEITKNDSNTVTYHGPGEIWQDGDGNISFKCICQDVRGTVIKYILNDGALEVGKLIPDNEYYSMQLTTFDNVRWSAENSHFILVAMITIFQLDVQAPSTRPNRQARKQTTSALLLGTSR
jgi:hypothetical protein